MADKDARTLDVVHEVSRTADRLAKRMGAEYVLDRQWQTALNERSAAQPSVNARR